MPEKPILFNADMEEWRPISGYEGRYEISNYGRVKSLDSLHKTHFGKILKPWIGNKHYRYIALRNHTTRKTFAVHRLVLETFIGPRPKGKQVAHWDGDPANNFVGNLRWATAKENIDDRKRHGRTAEGEKAGCAKLDEKCVKTINKLKNKGFSKYEIGHLACVSYSAIERIWNGETWRCVK